jgi:purine nucleosidase/pyrimidine-specific ribonucleoside hydrolase
MTDSTKNVIVDCDPGIDDSVAILFALSHPLLNIRAITAVSGNLLADTCSNNARKILHLSGRDEARQIPVARGPLRPLVRPYPRDPFSHGADGLGDLGITDDGGLAETGQFAADLILETVEKYKNEGVSIICLGPLTNIALALMKDPALPSKVSEVYHIGGSFGFNNAGSVRATGGNPVSEWNVYVDPEAADIVYKANFNFIALGLDITTRPDIELSAEHRARLREGAKDIQGGACPQFLLDVVNFGESRQFASWCCLIDSVAVAIAIDPALVVCEEISVAVETQSTLSLGQTIVDRRERKDHRWKDETRIKAAKDIDASRFLDLLVATLVGDIPRK